MLMKTETMKNRFLVAKVTQAFTVKVVVLVHLLNVLSLLVVSFSVILDTGGLTVVLLEEYLSSKPLVR